MELDRYGVEEEKSLDRKPVARSVFVFKYFIYAARIYINFYIQMRVYGLYVHTVTLVALGIFFSFNRPARAT